ncbi:hypothetical protein Tco_1022859, partial [Tanacetum coccineum]
ESKIYNENEALREELRRTQDKAEYFCRFGEYQCGRVQHLSQWETRVKESLPPRLRFPRAPFESTIIPQPFDMAANGAGGAGPPPAGGGGLPVPDLRTMEELCQPSLDGRGGPIAPIAIQATTFELKMT